MSVTANEVGSRIEGLLEELSSVADPTTRSKAEELVRLLIELYGAGLERIAEIVALDESGGERLLRRLAEDELVEGLLVLHGLHPVPVDERIQQALETVRPYLGSHAGGVEYLGVGTDGVARLRLQGSCDGCPSSTVTVKLAIERAILDAAPEVTAIHVEGVAEAKQPAGGLVQIEPLGAGPNGAGGQRSPGERAQGWRSVGDLGLLAGNVRAVDVAGLPVVVCRAGEDLYAYRNSCAGCGSSLEGGTLEGEWLTCRACAQSYNVRLAGRSRDAAGVHLDPLPLLADGGAVSIAIPAGADR